MLLTKKMANNIKDENQQPIQGKVTSINYVTFNSYLWTKKLWLSLSFRHCKQQIAAQCAPIQGKRHVVGENN